MDNKDFDFDKAGLQTPYTVPEGFFRDMQQHIVDRMHRKAKRRRRLTLTAALGLAAAVAGLVFLPEGTKKDLPQAQKQLSGQCTMPAARTTADDDWIDDLSDDDLETMASQANDDIFLN